MGGGREKWSEVIMGKCVMKDRQKDMEWRGGGERGRKEEGERDAD